jgi:hypothetical protein
VISAELGAAPARLGQLEDLLLELQIAEGPSGLVAGGG